MKNYKEYHEQVLTELEKLGLPALVNEYQPPEEATAKFIADCTRAGFSNNAPIEDCAKLTLEMFIETAHKAIKAN